MEQIIMDHNPIEKYTSTGSKFWRHRNQMENYKSGNPRTVISTHISPEGICNLDCHYCSVAKRNTEIRINFDTIKKYINDLKLYGLKAVILTGGGEPTIYPQFNELVRYIYNNDLSVSLITNGTLQKKVDDDVWGMFSWVRVSVNIFPNWEKRINIPTEKLSPDCVLGCSMVYTPYQDNLLEAQKIADKINASYVRVLPNCLLPQNELDEFHLKLEKKALELNDERFFRQNKNHKTPSSGICHQSYFRPYLSEALFNGVSGTVYPCDSVVLNPPEKGGHGVQHFSDKYALCHASNIVQYLQKDIVAKFNPSKDCTGCVFHENIEMLNNWMLYNEGEFVDEPIVHEEFV